jgi:dTMP kinase
MFITFEGIDQCGKSTQARLLYQYLKKKYKKVILVREPGGTKVSEKIRDILLDSSHSGMKFMTEYLLFSASRHQLTEEVIKPHLQKGFIVICDRYYDSSTAYQGYGGGIERAAIEKINLAATGGLKPDITFLINITYKKAVERKRSLKREDDRIEKRRKAFYSKVAAGYLEIAAKNKKRFRVIEGSQSIEAIEQEIKNTIESRLKAKQN